MATQYPPVKYRDYCNVMFILGLSVSQNPKGELDSAPYSFNGIVLCFPAHRILCGQWKESSVLEIVSTMVLLGLSSRSRNSDYFESAQNALFKQDRIKIAETHFNYDKKFQLLSSFRCYLCIVNFIRIIFCLYITVLAVYPCYDDCKDEGLRNVVGTEQGPEENGGLCTPFCTMSCNTTHPFFNDLKVEVPTNQLTPLTQTFVYRPPFYQQLVSTIWQPPKLA